VRRLFALVAAVVFLDTMFYGSIAPLLPTFADEHDLSKTAAGVLSASYAAGTLIGSFPSGWLAARIGPRATLVIGLGLIFSSSVVFALAESIALLDIARFAQGLGGACAWTGGLAWLMAEAPAERRGEVIGSALAAAIAGALFGPVLGGAAVATSRELVFGVVAALAALLAIRARAMPRPSVTDEGGSSVLATILQPRVLAGFWLVALPALASGVINVLVPLHLDELGAGGIAIGAIFLAAAGVEAALAPFVGRFSDRRGRALPILAGLVVAALLVPVQALPDATWLAAAAVIALVAGMALFWGPAMALLSDAAEQAGLNQGYAFALVNFAWAGGQVLGGSGGSTLAEATEDLIPYLAVTALFVATLAVLLRVRLRGFTQAPAG
jgi:MFS family permease